MKKIELTRGLFAMVDDSDFVRTNALNWHAQPKRKTHYAIGQIIVGGKRTTRRMHRLLMDAKPGQIVDHVNGNGLDNRMSNLRITCAKGNARNRRHYGQSPFKGVRCIGKSWVARISENRKVKTIGYFASAKEAAAAYDREASKLFGETAYLNFGGNHEKAS